MSAIIRASLRVCLFVFVYLSLCAFMCLCVSWYTCVYLRALSCVRFVLSFEARTQAVVVVPEDNPGKSDALLPKQFLCSALLAAEVTATADSRI